MRRILNKIILFLLIGWPLRAFDQESRISLNGYVKDLFMFYTPEYPIPGIDHQNLWSDIIHNRINFKWYTTDKLTTVVEMRNRLFFGSLVKDIPEYQNTVKVDYGLMNLSWFSAQGNGWFLHSMIDRAYLDYSTGKWQIRAGRQRINWGMNLVWNPNDIFNSFSYFDFDYEERPGTDAVRIQYYTGTTSSVEMVVKPEHDQAHSAIAGLYRFSKWKTDFQLMGGQAGNDWVIGTGWSGDIKGAGFRGEFTHFQPLNQFSKEASVASVSADYTFTEGWYLHSSVLFNSLGKTGKAGGMKLILNNALSAKTLSVARWSVFGQVSKPINPLLTASFAGIVNPSDGSFYLGPELSYSLLQNLELMLVGQLFFGELGTEFGDIGQIAFGRLKWSF